MTKRSQNNAAELEELEMQVRKTRQLVHQCGLKVEAIEASINEIEKFHPTITIVRSPARLDRTANDRLRLSDDQTFLNAA